MEHNQNNIHLIKLDINRCNGCINCLKRCPTQAIRVRDKKAFIQSERCIGCGVCVHSCPHKANRVLSDNLSQLKDYKYCIALPPPSIYAQFNNIEDNQILNEALKAIGFDEVFEVTSAAELIREARGMYIEQNRDRLVFPIISTNCSVITRLIQVKYPNLINNLLPMITPVELSGIIAKERVMKETGLKSEEIGCVFLAPCPSKVSETYFPIGVEKRNIDLAIAINDIYSPLLKQMESIKDRKTSLSQTYIEDTDISEDILKNEPVTIKGINKAKYLKVDGIENAINVLDAIESHDYGLEYVDLLACNAGCFGGVLQVENPFIARTKDQNRKKTKPNLDNNLDPVPLSRMLWDKELEYIPVMELGGTRQENFERYGKLQGLIKSLPGIDCGRCGAPSCESFAEDVVKSNAEIRDCVVVFREQMENVFKMMEASFDAKNDESS